MGRRHTTVVNVAQLAEHRVVVPVVGGSNPLVHPISRPAPASPVADFEASLDQLEQLVEKMEHGEMSLEESLAAYERGVGLYRKCQTALEQAELRVRLLSDPEQPEQSEPFGAPAPDA